jgi:hypothetical protein
VAAPQIAPLAPDFVLESGMQVVITAIDSTTGSLVSGVNVANISMSVDSSLGEDAPVLDNPTPFIVPVSNTA